MLQILSTALNAVLPIILLSVFGYWFKRAGFLSAPFVKTGSWFVFHVCLPCTLFVNVYNISDFSSVAWDAVIYCVAVVCLLFLLGLVASVLTTKDYRRRGVLVHAIFRSNFAVIGLSLASALGGENAMSVAAIVSAFTIPLYNVLGVMSLTVFSEETVTKRFSFKHFVVSVLENPMIVGSLLGAACILLRLLQNAVFGDVVFTLKNHLSPAYSVVNSLKTMTTPLALIVLGAQFEFSAVKGLFKEILVGTLWRIVLAPLIGVGLAVILNRCTDMVSFGLETYPTLIAMFGAPVAVSTAVIASEMDGDEQLATQLVVWTSLGSVVTVYVAVCIMMAVGLLTVA